MSDKEKIENKIDNTDWRDKYLRLLSDFENYKKRERVERENLTNSVKSKSLESVMEVVNDIIISRVSLNDEQNKLIDTFYRKLENWMTRNSIELIPNDIYNEDLHEVVFKKPATGLELPGDIIGVAYNGWKVGGNIVKYSKIIIAE